MGLLVQTPCSSALLLRRENTNLQRKRKGPWSCDWTLDHAHLCLAAPQDDETLSHLAPGTRPPEPVLYDRELHKHHRAGHYHPIRKEHPINRIVQIEPQRNVS